MNKKRFRLDPTRIFSAITRPSDEYIKEAITENNSEFSVVTELFSDEVLVLECENQPRDMPLFGYHWEEIKNADPA